MSRAPGLVTIKFKTALTAAAITDRGSQFIHKYMTTEADPRGALLTCPKCGQRNRMLYERLGRPFRCGKCHNELAPLGEPINVKNDQVFDALIKQVATPVLVDFWAPWCGPCKMVAPEIARVASEAAGKFVVVKVNTEESPLLAGRFRISAIPTMVIFKSGAEVARQAGAIPAPGIRKFLQPFLS
ncbi:MAG: thioredoxin 2 [Verrucomicrobiota bacterium]|jgi:thioredoxin 2